MFQYHHGCKEKSLSYFNLMSVKRVFINLIIFVIRYLMEKYLYCKQNLLPGTLFGQMYPTVVFKLNRQFMTVLELKSHILYHSDPNGGYMSGKNQSIYYLLGYISS